MNWDDVRLFLSIARMGSSRAAAKDLGVNQSTVSRRLRQLEHAAGVQLFDRKSEGLRLTEAGTEMAAVAERIENEFALLGRQVLGRDVRLGGQVRVSLPDFIVGPLAPILADFGRRYPAISVDLSVNNEFVSLTQREADVALRLGTSAPDHLVGRRIGSASAAIYGAASRFDRPLAAGEHARLDWVRWGEYWRGIPPERWIGEHVPPAQVRARLNSNHALTELIASGVGVGFLLRLCGDGDPRLRRISEPFDFGLSLWLLTHEDLRRTARIAAFMRFVGDALVSRRGDIEGE